jgi:hypothetical protein
MDQLRVKPLAGIVQVFESLLFAVLGGSQAKDASFKAGIMEVLAGEGSFFLSLLSPSWQRSLLGKPVDIDPDGVDWALYAARFKVMARRLFGLFTARSNLLVLVIGESLEGSPSPPHRRSLMR